MSSSTALFSKLKILVAKLYKAEKLYSSMRRIHSNESNQKPKIQSISNSHKIRNNSESQLNSIFSFSPNDSAIGGQSLIEHANDIRSHEWYKVHHSFRVKLNDILSLGNTYALETSLSDLWQEFLAEFEVAELDLQECNQAAKDSLHKEEYSYLFKLSSELIRRKAKLQALKVIHDELNSLLSQLLSKHAKAPLKQNFLNFNEALNSVNSIQKVQEPTESVDDAYAFSNVIPLRRKAAN